MTSGWLYLLLLRVFVFHSHCCVTLDDVPQQPPRKRRKFGSKVSSVTLSEIDMMRRLVLNLHDTPPSWKKRPSACSWKGVKCNAESQVSRLQWRYFPLSGNLTWSYLPPHVTYVNTEHSIIGRALTGILHSSDLVTPLESFNAAEHTHRGVFDFTTLPVQLQELYIKGNKLEGPVDLTQLPPKIRKIYSGDNRFEGPIELHALPPGISVLALNDNMLTGTLDLDHLPKSMGLLALESNRFEGTTNLSSLPSSLWHLDLSKNQLTGVTAEGLDKDKLKQIHLSDNLFDSSLEQWV